MSEFYNRFVYVFDIYLAPLFLLCVGIAFTMLAFTISLPKATDLLEIRGQLDSYYFRQSGRGRDDYETIVILKDGYRFWTNALDKYNAENILSTRGEEIKFYIKTNSSNTPIDGAVKSYGLWVNGQQIESLEDTFKREKLYVRFGFPIVGSLCVILAFFVYRRSKAKYAS